MVLQPTPAKKQILWYHK